MKYAELKDIMNQAWHHFFSTLEYYDVDADYVESVMDNKDCFNDVFSTVISCVELEEE